MLDKNVILLLLLKILIRADLHIAAVPLSALNPSIDIINSNAINGEDNSGGGGAEEIGIDDFTTHGLERLSSAATCLVAGVEYTHGQQIYRADPCEFCLCLDGEMFCWWQDCPPTMEGPCKDRGPFTPCLNEMSFSSASLQPSSAGLSTINQAFSDNEAANSSPSSDSTENSTLNDASTTLDDDFSLDDNSTEEAVPSSSPGLASTMHEGETTKYCVVMGQRYKIGDKLPHDTGNCVECVCGQGAKVTCSPHQCAPAGDDINDYRPPGPRQQVQDVF